jgi:hypothetical protein
MDVKDKPRFVIEFRPSEGCAGEEIVMLLRNIYASARYGRAAVFRWINEIRRDNEEVRNEGHPGRPYPHETDAVTRSILQEDPNTLRKLYVGFPMR